MIWRGLHTCRVHQVPRTAHAVKNSVEELALMPANGVRVRAFGHAGGISAAGSNGSSSRGMHVELLRFCTRGSLDAE